MKICVVTTVFPRWRGDGEGAFIWQFVKSIRQAGVDVRVVAMHSPGVARHETIEGIEVVRYPYWWPTRWEMLRKDGGGLPINFRRYRLARIQIATFAAVHSLAILRHCQDCDLIHAQFTLSAAAAALSKPIHHLPVIATVLGSDIYQIPRLPFGTWFTRQTLRACVQVTTLSHDLRQETLKFGVAAENVQVITNSIDTTQFTPVLAEQRKQVILFVGWLIKRKGVEYLMRAMQQISQELPQFQLLIIGDGPEKSALGQLAQQLGMSERVQFLGFLPQTEVRHWMQQAKLLVLPSLEEGQGSVLLEALACGTPVVGSAVGGIGEVIDESVGALVPPGNVELLAKAIIQSLLSPAAWEKMSVAARRKAVEMYDGTQIAHKYIEIYTKTREVKHL